MDKGEEEIKNHLFFKMINWVKVGAREVQPPFKPKIVSINVASVRLPKRLNLIEPQLKSLNVSFNGHLLTNCGFLY